MEVGKFEEDVEADLRAKTGCPKRKKRAIQTLLFVGTVGMIPRAVNRLFIVAIFGYCKIQFLLEEKIRNLSLLVFPIGVSRVNHCVIM